MADKVPLLSAVVARLKRHDLPAVLVLLLLPALFFRETLFGGKVLLPTDNLFQWPPYRAFAEQFGVERLQNQLLSDLILQNYPWKRFLADSLQAGELPLWNPYLFGGVPFLAAGQHSALYPFSVFFFTLSTAQAFAAITVVNLFLGGLFMYAFLRLLSAGRTGALVGAVAYAFSGFMVVSVVFPMVISAAIWLPLLLTFIELSLRRAERGEGLSLLPPIGGAVVVGVVHLAGHVEITLYVLIVAGFFTAGRLWSVARGVGWRAALSPAGQALAMVAFGSTLAAVQVVPLYELVTVNFRQGSAPYHDVISWAYTWRQVATFFIPDFWGNPSHTSYFDLLAWANVPVTTNYHGQPIQFIMAAGVKNYVEAGAYLGLLPLLLALVAVLRVRDRYTWIFLALAVVSLLFTFGAPTYQILYYLVPGWNQLHTPFRWVFPYTFCLCVLAGLGAGWLVRNGPRLREELAGATFWRWGWRALAWVPLLAGATGLLGLAGALLWRQEMVALADRLIARSASLQAGFASGQMLFSFEFRNLLVFSLALLGAGLVIFLAIHGARLPVRWGGGRAWAPAAVALVWLELWTWGGGFNPATDPALLDFVPPAIEYLKEDPELFRVTGYGDDSLHPNMAMIHGIADIRGYDSIIPKQYIDFMNLIEEQWLLDHNRVARLREAEALDSPLLDLLNVKYVVTEGEIVRPGYRQVYDGEMRVYLNEDHLPRAFVVPQAQVVAGQPAVAAALLDPSFDPRRTVLLEVDPTRGVPSGTSEVARWSAEVQEYRPTRIAIDVDTDGEGFLVLGDSYFPGWRAFVDGEQVEVLRANYNFRAVHLPAGRHEVVFRYVPDSFVLGGFASLVTGMGLLLGLVFALWRRWYRERDDAPAVRRVAKNSLAPMAASFGNKAVDFFFAMLVLRLLGPEGVGKYAFAVVVVTCLEIFTNFGLNTLLTREVAKDKAQGNSYLCNTALLRLALWGVSLPLLAGLVMLWRQLFGLADDTILAIALLTLATLPAHGSAAISSLFVAHERMEYTAGVSIFTTLLRVALGVAALIAGLGFVGLAGVAVATNLVTLSVLLYAAHRVLPKLRLEVDWGKAKAMLGIAFPLMLNHFLAVVFFRVDTLMLQPLRGDAVVGWYNTAYKFVDGLNVIPSTFTFALFPILSRYAASGREALHRSYCLALKYLLILSFPIAVGTALLAEDFILFFGGEAYLPHSVIALQILIWFLPFSYVNSVTQYVLIALNEQKLITRSFLVAAPFNIVANLILIPMISYQGAAVATILSEIVLLVPFLRCVHRHLPRVPLWQLSVRPAGAAAFMGGLVWLAGEVNPLLVIPLAAASYFAVLLALGTFDREDRTVLRLLLGGRPEAPAQAAEA